MNLDSFVFGAWKCCQHATLALDECTEMKPKHILLFAAVSALGLPVGMAAKRLTRDVPVPVANDTGNPQKTRSQRASADDLGASGKPAVPPKLSTVRTTDTLDTLTAPDADPLYSRLALWMMDASEQDIAAYWESVRDQKDRPNQITDLVFINWTRLNPRGAIAAVAGTKNEHYAWWAWACHEPQEALTAALAANPDRVNNVAWGLGEFQAEWLRAHWDQIPEAARNNAIRGMTKWDDTDKPLEVLEFLKKQDAPFNQGIFSTLIRKDPYAALDWMQENQATISRYYGDKESVMKELVETMARSQPDSLQRLADQTPSGELKRKMEAALFDNLVLTDPDAALEQAKSTKAPAIATQRLATVGMNWVESDPDKAFEVAAALFKTNPNAMSVETTIEGPDSVSSWHYSNNNTVEELVTALMTKDPARTMELQEPDSQPFGRVANIWAELDVVSYTHWVNQQADPETRDKAASVLVNQLIEEEQFTDAAEWAMSSKTARENLINLIHQWNQSDPAEAKKWLETTNLTESERANLERFLKRNP
jgi:AcrR family transcriptional regulator